MIKEKVGVTPYRPFAWNDNDVLPFRTLSHFLGAEAAGVKHP